MTDEYKPSHSVGARLWEALVTIVLFVLRLTIVLVLAVGLGAAVYYGVVYGSSALYRQYVRPVRENSTRLDTLETMRELDYQGLAVRLESLQERLNTLEIRGDSRDETLSSLQTQLESAESALAAMEDAQATTEAVSELVLAAQATSEANQITLQAALDDLTASLAVLDEMQAELDALSSRWVLMQEDLNTLQTRVVTLDESLARNQEAILALDEQRKSEESPLAALQRELQLIKVIELLARSRVFLSQGSPGLAQQDVQAGRDLLLALQGEVPAYQLGTLVEMIARLDAILENLPEAPVSAAGDLEVAWQLLLNGLPAALESTPAVIPPGGETTPTLEATVPVTPALSPTPEATTAP
jgi:hypothetical protein